MDSFYLCFVFSYEGNDTCVRYFVLTPVFLCIVGFGISWCTDWGKKYPNAFHSIMNVLGLSVID